MSEKMTHSVALSQAIALLSSDSIDRTEIIEHLTALRATLDKRAEHSKGVERKPSKAQIAARAETAKLIDATFDKIRYVRSEITRRGLQTLIEVDGGVNVENAPLLFEAGADILVAGSAVFHAEDMSEAIRQMLR